MNECIKCGSREQLLPLWSKEPGCEPQLKAICERCSPMAQLKEKVKKSPSGG
jgi:hypothetical protein